MTSFLVPASPSIGGAVPSPTDMALLLPCCGAISASSRARNFLALSALLGDPGGPLLLLALLGECEDAERPSSFSLR